MRIVTNRVKPQCTQAALRQEAHRLAAMFDDEEPERRRELQMMYLSGYNDVNIITPVPESELERILDVAINNPGLSADAKAGAEISPALKAAAQVVEKLGVAELERILGPSKAAVEVAEAVENWRTYFKSVDELPDGDVRMIINDFLPEGVSFLGALSGHGKTLFALSMVKSLTTGKPFLGLYQPEEVLPCLYLIPESSGRAFKMRCKAFGIPRDPEVFLCRTVSEGATLLLDDPILKKAVETLKPVVFLDTMIRFSQSEEENSASQNQKLARDIIELRAAGAVSVIGLHHATKATANEEITLENALRGTGDIAALCDSVYAIKRDELLFDSGNGPTEIAVKCVKDRDIKNPPKPFRIAARYKKEDGTLASYIDETGDFHVVETAAVIAELETKFIKIINSDKTISRGDLAKDLGLSEYALRNLAKKLGWKRASGGSGEWCLMTMKEAQGKVDPESVAPVQPVEAQRQLEML
jgi:hypothetical protein